MYMRIYMYICIYTHIHIHIHVWTYLCTYTYIYIHIYIHIYIYVYITEELTFSKISSLLKLQRKYENIADFWKYLLVSPLLIHERWILHYTMKVKLIWYTTKWLLNWFWIILSRISTQNPLIIHDALQNYSRIDFWAFLWSESMRGNFNSPTFNARGTISVMLYIHGA